MSRALAQINELDVTAIESVVAKGDLAQLSAEERVAYYVNTCRSLGLNPFTKPFDFINLNNKLTMYANRGCTDQLRDVHGVNIVEIVRDRTDEMITVTATAVMPNGRRDTATGIVWIQGLKGDALVNALMKAETKAKRRVTLSICGLGWMDETEIETVRGARSAPQYLEELPSEEADDEDVETKRYRHFQNHGPMAGMGQPQTEPQMRKLWAEANERGWHRDQVYGRATEIDQRVTEEGLHALDRQQLGWLINAVISEQPWVDPRQQRLDIDAPVEAQSRVVDGDPERFDDVDSAATDTSSYWTPKGSLHRWLPSNDPGTDIAEILNAAATAINPDQITELWTFAKNIGLGADDDLKGRLSARRRDLGGSSGVNGSSGNAG